MLLGLIGSLASSALNTMATGRSFSLADTFTQFGTGFVRSFGSMLPSLFSGAISESHPYPIPRVPRSMDTDIGRKMMDLGKQREALNLSLQQAESIRQARQKIATQQAFFSNRGFAKGGSTLQVLQNESLENLRDQLNQEEMVSHIRVLEANVRQLQSNYSALNNLDAMPLEYEKPENPIKRGLRKNFLEPMQRESWRQLGNAISDKVERWMHG